MRYCRSATGARPDGRHPGGAPRSGRSATPDCHAARRLRGLQRRGEVEIARLVVRRVGVGDVGRQHLAALRAQIQGGMRVGKELIDSVEHWKVRRIGFRLAQASIAACVPRPGTAWTYSDQSVAGGYKAAGRAGEADRGRSLPGKPAETCRGSMRANCGACRMERVQHADRSSFRSPSSRWPACRRALACPVIRRRPPGSCPAPWPGTSPCRRARRPLPGSRPA